MKLRVASVLVALTAVGMVGPPLAWGQARQTSTLTGTVTDSTGAVLPGVTVTITSPNMIGGAQTSVTDSEGVYRFPAIMPGVYELTAELASFRTVRREGLRISVGNTITVDIPMDVSTLSESVTVTGESPVVDVKSSAANTQLDNEILQNLPTARFQPDVINLTPGVTGSVAFGGSQSSNALLMDGVDVSDPEGGSPWSFFNYNWIQEVQVVSLGANAEYGEFTGVAANSIIKSGSNRFSGLFEHWRVPGSWLSDNTQSLPEDIRADFEPAEIDTNWDSTMQLGGPILRDKLWFFTGFQYLKEITRPAGFTGGFETERSPRFLTKVNWAPASAVRVEGFVEVDKFDVTGRGASPTRPPETTVIEPSPEVNWNGRVTWTINSKTLFDIRNGGYDGYFPLEPTPPGTREGPAPHFDSLTGMYSVNAPYFGRFDRTRNVLAATLTRYADNFAGKNHEFKFGFEFERSKIRNESGYPGDRYYYDYGGEPYIAYLWEGYVTDAVSKRAAIYAQDTWTVTDRLTLNPGIRLNINRGSVPEQGNVFSTTPISPRIGLAWDVMGDHKTVVRAHYGRYYDALLGGMYEFMDTSQQHPFITAEVLAPGGCQAGIGPDCVELDRFEPENNFGIDADIKHSYLDQYLIGVERELFTDFSLQLQYIRRNFEDFVAFVDTGSIYEPVQRQDPGPDNRLGTADDGEFLTVFNLTNPGNAFRLLTNPPDAFRRYNAFQVVGRKRFSKNWQTNASYTWSKTEGNVNSELSNNAAGGGAEGTGQTGIFANPNEGLNQVGRTTFDFTHQVKLEGTYRVPFLGGFNLSGIYRYTTGSPWGRRATIRGLDQGTATVRIEPRGTRRLDAINNVDLRIEKTIPIRDQFTAGFYIDMFNLNNQGVHNSEIERAVLDVSGESFGQPRRWIAPRSYRAGFRFTF
jgi:hypothetical protein